MVFGVNPGSLKSHERFSEKHGFPFSPLVDEGGEVGMAYGTRTLNKLAPLRTVVGIDKRGVVVYYERGMPSTEEILAGIAGDGRGLVATSRRWGSPGLESRHAASCSAGGAHCSTAPLKRKRRPSARRMSPRCRFSI